MGGLKESKSGGGEGCGGGEGGEEEKRTFRYEFYESAGEGEKSNELAHWLCHGRLKSLFLTGLDSFTAYDIRRKGDKKTADFMRKHKKLGHLGFLFHSRRQKRPFLDPYFNPNSSTNSMFLPPIDAPTVRLSFGSNLDPTQIAEGNDVYFECKISANPDVYKVVWLHNVSP